MIITLNRPHVLNAIDADMSAGIARAVDVLDSDASLRVGVIVGAGGVFCSGMDLAAFSRGEEIPWLEGFLVNGARKPLVAAVEGVALAGGLEVALTCDVIVAGREARLGVPEVTVGLFAAGGGIVRLAQRVGLSKAMEMSLTGDAIEADEAVTHGLVNRVVDRGAARDEALKIAAQIARNAPLAVSASKYLLRQSVGMTESEYWVAQRAVFASVFGSRDAREGPRAFTEKRQPVWTGT